MLPILTSCQPGSDTPGSSVGLWAGAARHRPRSVLSFHLRSTGLGSQESHRFGRRDHDC